MKLAIIILILIAPLMRMGAQEKAPAPHPDAVFRLALQEIESDFVAGMRQLAAKAAVVRVYRLGGLKEDLNPFSFNLDDTLFRVKEGAYTILKAGNKITSKEVIRSWAEAVLPKESHPFAMCAPSPGFAVMFLDSDGVTVYATTICLKCQSTAMDFPMYSSRMGFDLKAMERLLTAAGFSTTELKVEQGTDDQLPAHTELKNE